MRSTMSTPTPPAELLELARRSIDERQLHELLAQTTDGEVDERTVQALREVVAEELVVTTLGAASRARRRARPITADDIVTTKEERCQPASCSDDASSIFKLLPHWESD